MSVINPIVVSCLIVMACMNYCAWSNLVSIFNDIAFMLIVTCYPKMIFTVHITDCHCKYSSAVSPEIIEKLITVSNINCVFYKNVNKRTVIYVLLKTMCLFTGIPNKPIMCLTGCELWTSRNTVKNNACSLIVMFCIIVVMLCDHSISKQRHSMVFLLPNISLPNGCGTYL